MAADEMIVWSRVAVETIRSDSRGKLLDLADFRKQIRVAVDGSKADIRELPSDIQIYGLGGRVIIPGYKKILDRLRCLLYFSMDAIHPFLKTSNCY